MITLQVSVDLPDDGTAGDGRPDEELAHVLEDLAQTIRAGGNRALFDGNHTTWNLHSDATGDPLGSVSVSVMPGPWDRS